MTRAEQAAEKLRKEKEKAAELNRLYKEDLAKQQTETRKAEAALREATRKADNKRRYHWGAVAQEAGLFDWSNADWQAVCAVLARLADVPHPAALLEAVLCENGVDVHGGDFLPGVESLYRASSLPPRPEGELSELPSLETADESDRREAKKQGPAAAKVFI